MGKLGDGQMRQDTHRKYKSANENHCFELNGALKAGLELGGALRLSENMSKIIRAVNREEIVVHRMTSDMAFTPSGPRVAYEEPFSYPAFLSTTRAFECLPSFYPSTGTPTVLEITCPAGTIMALMEKDKAGTQEAEFLLGAATHYKIDEIEKLTSATDRLPFVGRGNINKCSDLFFLKLTVVGNPFHLNQVSDSEIFNWS